MNNAASQLNESSVDETLEKRKFLRDEVLMLTLMAVTQRGQIYAPKSTNKKKFRGALHEYLKRMAEVYKVPIAEEVHVRNVASLASQLTESCGELLYKKRFRIGSAQKALNLLLKYLWCLGEIPEPPHCPFDRRIIEHLPKGVQCNWTQCNDIEHYKGWVAAAREEAKKGSLSLAQWELCTFNM